MNKILLSHLFTLEEIKELSSRKYEESFGKLIIELEKITYVAEHYPVSFSINSNQYSFPNKETLEKAIAELKNEYDMIAMPIAVPIKK